MDNRRRLFLVVFKRVINRSWFGGNLTAFYLHISSRITCLRVGYETVLGGLRNLSALAVRCNVSIEKGFYFPGR